MATFECPDCTKIVSMDAVSCPNCGMPINTPTTEGLTLVNGILSIALAGLAIIIVTKDEAITWVPVIFLILFTAYMMLQWPREKRKTKRAQDLIKKAKITRKQEAKRLNLEASLETPADRAKKLLDDARVTSAERAKQPVPRNDNG